MLRPGDRDRVRNQAGRVAAALLGATLLALVAWAALAVWHLIRRGRLIQERLEPPRPIRWPEEAEGRDRPPPPKDE
jgi:hypothetical protein